MTTQKDQISYILGYQIGGNFKQQGISISPEINFFADCRMHSAKNRWRFPIPLHGLHTWRLQQEDDEETASGNWQSSREE